MARKNKGTKKQKKSIYIVGEGITEQYYFQHLKRLKDFTCIVKPRLFGNTNVWEIEKKIIELSSEDADIICVFDADVSKRNQTENERLRNLKDKYADNNKVLICDSLQCIEYWFILHYENICPAHNNGDETVRRLKRHIPDYDKSERYLEKSQWVERMSVEENLTNACQRAELHEDGLSYTNIYKAIDRLNETT